MTLMFTLLVVLGLGVASGQKKMATVWPAADVKWMQMKDGPPGGMIAPLWGDPMKGAYGALVKLVAGEKHPLHIHTHDVKLVVISGTFLYTPEGGTEQRLGPGSYLFVPGGLRHSSGTGDDGPCEIFQTGTGAFDMKPMEKMTKN
jgi:quercetin dioxygenase-like cupin family protein